MPSPESRISDVRVAALPAASEGYWAESRRPLGSLAFVAPLLVAYEGGVLFAGIQMNGADAWMRRSLDFLGFSQHFLLPLLTVGILLGCQYASRQPWRLSAGVIWTMVVESILLAVVLWLLLQLQRSLLLSIAGQLRDTAAQAVSYFGAGIYEELLFRLIGLSALAWALAHLRVAPPTGTIVAIAVTSLLFAAAHHVGAAGEPWQWFAFVFRFVAGVYFSILFVYRGFGIAAGAHAAYDILVGWRGG